MSLGDIGSAIGTGLDYIQGRRDRKQARLQFNIAQHHTIENRVKDARRAGIHPLYALGVSGVGSPTFMASAGQSDLGSKLGELGARIERTGEPKQSEMARAQLRAVNASANRDEAAAQNTLSAMRRAEVEFNSRPQINANGVPTGLIEAKKSEIVSAQKGKPGVTAGKKPAFMEVIVGKKSDGSPKTMFVPYSDEGPAESMEGMGAIGLTILKNMGLLDDRTPAEIKQIRKRLERSAPARYGLGR